MKTPDISSMKDETLKDETLKDETLKGVKKMTPLEMNGVRFEKNHTVLTPEILDSMAAKAGNASATKISKKNSGQ